MMNRWKKMFSLVWVFVALPAWAIDTGSTRVTAVDISSDSIVNVTINNNLPSICDEKLTFSYAASTLSDVYYTMLMMAKSVGLDVDLGYIEYTSLGYCELVRVEIFRRN